MASIFDRKSALVYRIDHTLVFADRDKGAGKSADVGGSHNAAFLHLVI